MQRLFESQTPIRLMRVPLAAGLWALAGWCGFLASSAYPLLDGQGFWQAVRGLTLLMAVLLWWFRNEQRSGDALGVWLFGDPLIGFFVVGVPFVATVCSGALVLNGFFDTSPAVRQQAVVQSKARVSGIGRGQFWLVSVRDERMPGEWVTFSERHGQPWIQAAQPGDRLWITTRTGALGWMWFTEATLVQSEPVQ
jgi:hypothetical protein